MVARCLRPLTYGLRLDPFRETCARSGATINNQILGARGRTAAWDWRDRASRGRTRRSGRFKTRFERIASLSRARLQSPAWCARRPDASAVAVARLHWPNQQDWRWFVAHDTSTMAPKSYDQAARGLFTTKERGDADRQRAGTSKDKVGLARRLAVSCIVCLPKEPLSTLEQSDRRPATVRAGHDTKPSRSEVPSPGQWRCQILRFAV